MNRRRRRFIAVGLERGGYSYGDTLILDYSATEAEIWLTSGGYLYTDLRPAKVLKAGFTIDQGALDRAIQSLGLKLTVKVRAHNRAGDTRGNYRLRPTKDGTQSYHDIMVKGYLTPEQASQTLWHELAHAMQAERAITLSELSLDNPASRFAWVTQRTLDKGTSYRQRPIEVEARVRGPC